MRVRTETLRLKRFDAGDGRHCAVLLHGLGGTHRYWTCGPEPFGLLEHRTVLLDLLGFGESPKPWIRYSVERHVGVIVLFVQIGALWPETQHPCGFQAGDCSAAGPAN